MSANERPKLITSDGQEYELRPVSDTLLERARAGVVKRFKAEGKPIDPPTYTIVNVAGEETVHEHDETTLEYPLELVLEELGEDADQEEAASIAEERTQENQQQWIAYLDAQEELAAAVNDMQMRVWLRGIVVDEEEVQNGDWIQFQEWLGAEIPEPGLDRWYHYMTTEVLKTPEDFLQVIQKLSLISYAGLVSEEVIESAIDSFRDRLQGSIPAGVEAEAEQMEAHAEVRDDASGEGVGDPMAEVPEAGEEK